MIGSVVYSMPFVVQPIRNAFEAFGERPLEVAATLNPVTYLMEALRSLILDDLDWLAGT